MSLFLSKQADTLNVRMSRHVASRSIALGPPLWLESSEHPWACLAFPQRRSCRCGSDTVVCLDGSHCAPHGTPHSSDLDTGADSPPLFSLVLSYVTSSPLFYHPLLESLPKRWSWIDKDNMDPSHHASEQ